MAAGHCCAYHAASHHHAMLLHSSVNVLISDAVIVQLLLPIGCHHESKPIYSCKHPIPRDTKLVSRCRDNDNTRETSCETQKKKHPIELIRTTNNSTSLLVLRRGPHPLKLHPSWRSAHLLRQFLERCHIGDVLRPPWKRLVHHLARR